MSLIATTCLVGIYVALRVLLELALSEETKWRLATNFALVSPASSTLSAVESLGTMTGRYPAFDTHIHYYATQACAMGGNSFIGSVMEALTVLSVVCTASSTRRTMLLAFGLFNPIVLATGAASSCWWVQWFPPALSMLILSKFKESPFRSLGVVALLVPHAIVNISSSALMASVCVTQNVKRLLVRFALLALSPLIFQLTSTTLTTAPGSVPPSIGVFWYMVQLVIPQYEKFFTIVFQLTPTVVAVPLALKVSHMEKAPLFILTLGALTTVFCKQQVVLMDIVMGGFIACAAFPEVVEETRYKYVTAATTLITIPLQVTFYNGWIHQQVANANFLFFAGSALHICQVIFVAQFSVAQVRLLRKG